MSRPRLLIITPDYPPETGGIQLLVHRLATTMSRLDPLVLAPGGSESHAFDRSEHITVHRLSPPPGGHRATIAALNAAALPLARRFRPDVVLSAHIVVSPAAAAIRRQLAIPTAQYLLAKEAATRPNLARFAVTRSDAIIAISQHTRDLGLHVGAAPDRLHLITPGVDLPSRQPRERLEQPTILTVARLEDRYKGHDTIIHALPLVLAQVPDAQWVVVGDGKLRGPLERLAVTYNVDSRVRFLGRVDDASRDAWLEKSHVFTMPSRVPGDGLGGEGFGIVYLEANWHEMPVVAGDAGGAVDAVLDGETGLLVDANDPVAIADALTRLLRDRELSRRFGRQGAERAQRFAWPIITERLEDVLLGLVATRNGQRVRQ